MASVAIRNRSSKHLLSFISPLTSCSRANFSVSDSLYGNASASRQSPWWRSMATFTRTCQHKDNGLLKSHVELCSPRSTISPFLNDHEQSHPQIRKTSCECRNHWACGSWENYTNCCYYKGAF